MADVLEETERGQVAEMEPDRERAAERLEQVVEAANVRIVAVSHDRVVVVGTDKSAQVVLLEVLAEVVLRREAEVDARNASPSHPGSFRSGSVER